MPLFAAIVMTATLVTSHIVKDNYESKALGTAVAPTFNLELSVADIDIRAPKLMARSLEASADIDDNYINGIMPMKAFGVGTIVTLKEEEEIPFAVERKKTDSMLIGETQVETTGVTGVLQKTYEQYLISGQEVSRLKTDESITTQPVTEVILVGTKPLPTPTPEPTPVQYSNSSPSRAKTNFAKIKGYLDRNGQKTYRSFSVSGSTITVDGRDFTFTSVGKRQVTGYEGGEVGNVWTASGIRTQRGVVASPFSGLPLGTVIFVENYGLAVVGDRCSSYAGSNLLDLCFDDHEYANGTVTLGRTNWNVYILAFP